MPPKLSDQSVLGEVSSTRRGSDPNARRKLLGGGHKKWWVRQNSTSSASSRSSSKHSATVKHDHGDGDDQETKKVDDLFAGANFEEAPLLQTNADNSSPLRNRTKADSADSEASESSQLRRQMTAPIQKNAELASGHEAIERFSATETISEKDALRHSNAEDVVASLKAGLTAGGRKSRAIQKRHTIDAATVAKITAGVSSSVERPSVVKRRVKSSGNDSLDAEISNVPRPLILGRIVSL